MFVEYEIVVRQFMRCLVLRWLQLFLISMSGKNLEKNEKVLKNYVYVYNIVFVEYMIWYNDLYNVNIDI